MRSTKENSVFIVMVLWVNSRALADTAKQVAQQKAAIQSGAAVIFFSAYEGTLRDVVYNPIIFNEVVVNQGSAYDNQTGIFTAPVSGIYQFVFAAQLCRGDHNNVWYFMINADKNMACHAQVTGTDTTLNTCYFMEELKTGDRVWVKQMAGSCAWASTISKTITFSGVLLAREGVSTLGAKYGSGSSCPLFRPGYIRSSAGRSSMMSSLAMAVLLCLLLSG